MPPRIQPQLSYHILYRRWLNLSRKLRFFDLRFGLPNYLQMQRLRVIEMRENCPVSRQVLTGAVCADVGSQKDMPEPVNVELIEIIFGEVQFETTVEVLDASFKLVPVQGRD